MGDLAAIIPPMSTYREHRGIRPRPAAPRDLLARCQATCGWPACTGRGDLEPWAHECTVAGVPRATPSCGIKDCVGPSVIRTKDGHRCADHAPPQPTSGYCAPNRCYCPTAGPCLRPAMRRRSEP